MMEDMLVLTTMRKKALSKNGVEESLRAVLQV